MEGLVKSRVKGLVKHSECLLTSRNRGMGLNVFQPSVPYVSALKITCIT